MVSFFVSPFINKAQAGTTLHILMHPVFRTVTGEGELFKEFEKETGIKVVGHTFPYATLMEKTKMELAAHSGQYDVMTISATWYKNDWGSQHFVDLRPLVKEMESFDDFSMRDTFIAQDGSLVGLPMRSGADVTHYRKDLFNEFGLEVPTTIEDMIHTAQMLTRDLDGDGMIDVYGFGFMGKQMSQLFNDYQGFL